MLRHAFMAAAALAFAGSAAAQPQVQTIELRSFSYSPRTIRLAAGKPVILAFVNRSGDAHDFTAKGFFARARLVSGMATGGEIELRGGQSRSLTLVPAAGRYRVHCGHFLHKQFGMSGEIVVQ